MCYNITLFIKLIIFQGHTTMNLLSKKQIFYFMTAAVFCFESSADTIFTAPDVFITSKIQPTENFEADRGNILFEGHKMEVKKNILLEVC